MYAAEHGVEGFRKTSVQSLPHSNKENRCSRRVKGLTKIPNSKANKKRVSPLKLTKLNAINKHYK